MEDSVNIDDSVTKNTEKSRIQKLYCTEPDRTSYRYVVDEIRGKAKQAKSVKFEDIDQGTYAESARLVGFVTSAERISIWVSQIIHRYVDVLNKATDFRVTWQEADSSTDNTKCSKILVHIFYTGSLQQEEEILLSAITIFVSTGRIQIQGNFVNEWTKNEFPLLQSLVDLHMNTEPTIADENYEAKLYEPYLGYAVKITKELNNPEKPNGDETTNFINSVSNETESRGMHVEPLIISPARVNTLNDLKSKFSALEKDFVNMKLAIDEMQTQMNQTVDNSEFYNKIKQLENQAKINSKALNDKLEDQVTQNEALKTELELIKKSNAKLQEQKSDFKRLIKSLETENQELKTEQTILRKDFDNLREFVSAQFTNIETDGSDSEDSDESQDSEPEKAENENLEHLTQERPLVNIDSNKDITNKKTNEVNEVDKSKQETEPEIPSTTAAKTKNLLFLCDSNGKYLRLKKLCPHHNTKYHRCATTDNAVEILKQTDSSETPEIILIHTGCNDIEYKGAPSTFKDICNLLSLTSGKFPSSRILFSSLLPRKDKLNVNVYEVNRLLRNTLFPTNVEIIEHAQLLNSDSNILFDKKHLNRNGVSLFARALTRSIYKGSKERPAGTHPRPTSYRDALLQRRHTGPGQLRRFEAKSHDSVNLYNTHRHSPDRQPHLPRMTNGQSYAMPRGNTDIQQPAHIDNPSTPLPQSIQSVHGNSIRTAAGLPNNISFTLTEEQFNQIKNVFYQR